MAAGQLRPERAGGSGAPGEPGEPGEPAASGGEKLILGADGVRRALTRIAHEILERNQGTDGLLLAGLRRRGVPLAERLAALVERFEGVRVPVGELDVTMFRDDLAMRGPGPALQRSSMPQDVTDARVVLVDDVLYTGRTVRAALEAILSYGRPRQIQLAVLVDRGHRELPIRADYVGKNLPTAQDEQVEVRLQEVDGRDEVALIRGRGDDRGDDRGDGREQPSRGHRRGR
jgi:pyrimidine operon attenuation protein / uracil phosphoribosyltransferase